MKRHAFIVAYCETYARHLCAEFLLNRVTFTQLLAGIHAKQSEGLWYWRTHTPARRRQVFDNLTRP